jgi:hypothetical protein
VSRDDRRAYELADVRRARQTRRDVRDARGHRFLAVAIAMCAGGCEGNSGLVSVTLTTQPGSTLLDGVQTLRVTNTAPPEVHEVSRTSSGFDLALDFEATGAATALIVDGLDAGGSVIAAGASPHFTLGPLDGNIVIYMAAPNSIGASPVMLEAARSELGVGPLSYGALLAGGRLASGAPTDTLSIYNAFDHSTVAGLPLPAPRAGLAVGIGANGLAYLFGGADETDAPTANVWRFDTTVAPAGQYFDYGAKPGFERANELAIPITNEHFLITGSPAAELNGLAGSVIARSDITTLPTAGAGLLGIDGVVAAIFAGPGGVLRYHGSSFGFVDVPAGARAGADVVVLPDGNAAIVCGSTDAIRIAASSGNAQTFPGVPSAIRTGCAVAATSRYLVIAGGTLEAGDLATTAEIYDARTLALIATTPLVVPRTGADAIALPNGQVLVAGGVDATGAPIATLELFTPAN